MRVAGSPRAALFQTWARSRGLLDAGDLRGESVCATRHHHPMSSFTFDAADEAGWTKCFQEEGFCIVRGVFTPEELE